MTGTRASGLFAVLVLVAALAGSAAQRAAAAFPGIDGKIAFVRGGDIYVINPDGSGETQLTSGLDFDFDPAWSPDGQQIAFSRNSDIWVMRSDGTQQVVLTTDTSTEGNPSWSPDGRRIAFERGHEIFVMNEDGSGAVNVTNHPEEDADPAWSPDGQRIAFTTRRDDQGLVEDRGEVYTMSPNGSALQRLTSNAGDDDAPGPGDRRPAWRPDGLELAFDSDRLRGTSGIFLMAPDGSAERQVPTAPLVTSFGPAWSPQGRELVFSGFDGSDGDLYVTTATGIRRLTTAPGFELAADWGPEPDRDGDGLPDRWETSLIDLDGDGTVDLDLAAMGAHPDRIDVFVEIDSMTGHKPSQAAVNTVVTAFANAPTVNLDGTTGIALHVDNGPGSIMDPRTGATWGSLSEADTVPHDGVLGSLDGVLDSQGRQGYVWAEFDLMKLQYFKPARKAVFHYAIASHRLGDATNGLAGLSRGVEASDFILSLGALCPTECNGSDDQQAGTLMHELGHNLGLRHGGNTDEEFKPNYLSVMNYLFQLDGLMILGSTGHYDYSRFGADTIGHLDENALSEPAGFGTTGPAMSTYGSAYACGTSGSVVLDNLTAVPVDWNCDTVVDSSPVAHDVNNDGSLDLLTSFDDWANLVYTGGSIAGAGAGVAPPGTTPLDEAPAEELIAKSIAAIATGDDDPPVTTATTAPAANAAGWHRDTVIVQLSAADGGSGVRELVYSLGGAETTVPGATVSIAVAAEGTTTLTYFARDAAGNAETPQTLVVRIDRTAPDAALRWSTGAHDLVVEGEDALSGVVAVTTTIAPVKKHESLRRYVVTDRAGNSRALDVLVREHGDDRRVAELPGAELDVHQRLDKAGGLRALDQKAIVGLRRVDADFEAKDGETRITDRTKGEPKQRFDRPGLTLLTLRVGVGGVAIDY